MKIKLDNLIYTTDNPVKIDRLKSLGGQLYEEVKAKDEGDGKTSKNKTTANKKKGQSSKSK